MEAEKRHADELAAVQEDAAGDCEVEQREIDRPITTFEHNKILCRIADHIRSLSPSGALEAIENRARLETAKLSQEWFGDHAVKHCELRDNELCRWCKYIADLEAKLAPKEPK